MKTTFRLPDELLAELRRRSRAEGRTLNATAVDALRRGLEQDSAPGRVADLLGDFVAQRATARYDPEAFAKALEPFGTRLRGLDEALEWTREERDL